jgi:hypothetical protein
VNPKKYRPFPQYKPTDGQKVWIVRFVPGGQGQLAMYEPLNFCFSSYEGLNDIPDYVVVEWRPAD